MAVFGAVKQLSDKLKRDTVETLFWFLNLLSLVLLAQVLSHSCRLLQNMKSDSVRFQNLRKN